MEFFIGSNHNHPMFFQNLLTPSLCKGILNTIDQVTILSSVAMVYKLLLSAKV